MLKHLTRNKRRRLTIRGTLSALVVATAVRQTIVGN